ncbi:glycosyltransferase family 4 protein [Thermanaerothrix sp.]|uniref:glycosyltransferase family 4 protein n=1 Tax=Thermanaerothrix sp. TaxID=2972675 RepID=UPI003C7C28D5
MRIVIDALGLPILGGARTSALGWINALGEYDRDNYYTVYLSQFENSLARFSNIEQRVVPVRSRFAIRVWAQLYFPFLLARKRATLLHCMKNLGVVAAPCPTIITINDLSHLILRHFYPWLDGFYWRFVQPFILRNAQRIIAISESTKRDLIRFYHLDPDKIVTIYPSCDEEFRQPCGPWRLKQVQSKYGLPKSFIMYVGSFGVHKNVKTLIRAFAQVAREVPHGLVLVRGAHHTTSDRSVEQEVSALGLEDRVWILGPIPDDELPCFYHLADLFVLVSLNEGFGLVLLEAMACGTPILAARSGGMPEVVGDAAYLIDNPMDPAEVASAIIMLLSDQQKLAEMSIKGLERSQNFTWEQTAKRTVELYETVGKNGRY